MKAFVVFSVTALLALPFAAAAIPEDDCTNHAVPRTTPSSQFTPVGDGSIVRHEPTSLEWQRCALGQTWTGNGCAGTPDSMLWQEALQIADATPGWRLPNIRELFTLAEECRDAPAINTRVFPDTGATGSLWSSSPGGVWSWNPDGAYGDGNTSRGALAFALQTGNPTTLIKNSWEARILFVREAP